MNTVELLFTQGWPAFLGVTIAFLFQWFVGCSASHGYFFFVTPKAFAELAPFPGDERKRLLHQASKETYRRWVPILPILAFAFVFSASLEIGNVIPKLSGFPDTSWLRIVLALPFLLLGGWLVERLSIRCVRPRLRRLIEKTNIVA
jgi:hypothetical protein